MTLLDLLREHPLPKSLSFTRAEYAARLGSVRERMGRDDIGLMIIGNSANQCWLTGYESVMPSAPTLLLVPREGDIEAICADLDVSCVELYSTVEVVHVESWHTGRDITAIVNDRLRALAPGKTRVGVELGRVDGYSSPGIDASTYQQLAGALDNDFIDITLLIPSLRLIKSEKEIDFMRQAGTYTAAGMQAALDCIAEGKTDNDVAAAFAYGAISAGSESMSIDPQIVTGDRCGYMPFLTHKRIALNAGDTVYLECTGVHNRYNAPLMRSAVIGAPDDTTRTLTDIALAAVEALIGAIKPGRTANDVAQSVAPVVQHLPDGSYFSGTYGYSCGLGLQPTWSEYPAYIVEGDDIELAPGMAFHLPIAIWSVSARRGIGFSETIAVTKTGCAVLTPGPPRELIVLQ
ncbi:MAG: hypothetical protein C0482_28785 [Gordonia sp.]|nr:hypothetical protein [Gordonia sp. (in: high G+C Gram-positive bacteria)]